MIHHTHASIASPSSRKLRFVGMLIVAAGWVFASIGHALHARGEMELIQRWLDREREKIGKRITWHEQGLRAFLWRSGQKTLRLIHGTLKRVAGREKIEVQDVDLFTPWAESDHPGLIRVKREPDKAACMKYVKATGEIPPGMDLVLGEDSFCVKFNEGEYR
jgi:hypothetical protein